MPHDNPRKSFSKRHGYVSEPKEITVWDDAPESLRHFVLHISVDEMGYKPSMLRDVICSVLRVRPNPDHWSPYPNIWNEVEGHVYECDWFKFYDFVEKVHSGLVRGKVAFSDRETAERFQFALNEFFIDEGIGWQMIDGEIVTRGTEIFESSVHGAVDILGVSGRTTAQNEIREALCDLSRRPKADLTGAVQHAMAALECVARDVCGDEQATLGEIIKKYPGTIPKPLDNAVEKAWGYASEMARHVREGSTPQRREVAMVVSIAATVATYLSSNPKDNSE